MPIRLVTTIAMLVKSALLAAGSVAQADQPTIAPTPNPDYRGCLGSHQSRCGRVAVGSHRFCSAREQHRGVIDAARHGGECSCPFPHLAESGSRSTPGPLARERRPDPNTLNGAAGSPAAPRVRVRCSQLRHGWYAPNWRMPRATRESSDWGPASSISAFLRARTPGHELAAEPRNRRFAARPVYLTRTCPDIRVVTWVCGREGRCEGMMRAVLISGQEPSSRGPCVRVACTQRSDIPAGRDRGGVGSPVSCPCGFLGPVRAESR